MLGQPAFREPMTQARQGSREARDLFFGSFHHPIVELREELVFCLLQPAKESDRCAQAVDGGRESRKQKRVVEGESLLHAAPDLGVLREQQGKQCVYILPGDLLEHRPCDVLETRIGVRSQRQDLLSPRIERRTQVRHPSPPGSG